MARPPKIPYNEIPKMKFGRLKPIRMTRFGNGRTKWLCECDCGKEIEVTQKNLTTGNTTSCGCLRKINSGTRTHGLSKTRLYKVFEGMKKRCYDEKEPTYKYYGAKGITICSEWLEDFKKFYEWAVFQGYDESLPRGQQTIDRIDVNGNYSPKNCRLITIAEQQRNKGNLEKYKYKGEEHLLCEWAEIFNIDFNFLRSRVCEHGWSIEEAINEPLYAKVKIDKKKISYNGKNLTIKEWSEKLGIPEQLIRSRMVRSKEPEYILQTEKNKRKDNIMITYKEKTQNLKEWSRELGISYSTLKSRIKRGWSAEQALSTSIRKKEQ